MLIIIELITTHQRNSNKFFVTLYVREATALDVFFGRNARISSYISAIDEIIEREELFLESVIADDTNLSSWRRILPKKKTFQIG